MDIKVEFCWADCFFLALLCLVVPLDWLFHAVAAAGIHELCHILALFSLKGSIYGIRIGRRGAVLDAASMDPIPELICILAGPAGSLSLWMLGSWCPKLAVCGMVQGVFNLLPLYPLDGGRALRCIAGLLLAHDKAVRLCEAVRYLFLLAFLCAGLAGIFVYDLGVLPVLAMVIFVYRLAFGKIPCNEDQLGVQYSYHL